MIAKTSMPPRRSRNWAFVAVADEGGTAEMIRKAMPPTPRRSTISRRAKSKPPCHQGRPS